MEKKLKLPSSISEIKKVENFIEIISDRFNIHHTYYSNILVSVIEAVKNAIIHGNKQNPEKEVTIYFKFAEGKCIFIIEDQGDGFLSVEETDGNNLSEQFHGYGLKILQTLPDRVFFKKYGAYVRLEFDVNNANEFLSQMRTAALKLFSKKEETKSDEIKEKN